MNYCKQNTTITKKPFETFLFEGLFCYCRILFTITHSHSFLLSSFYFSVLLHVFLFTSLPLFLIHNWCSEIVESPLFHLSIFLFSVFILFPTNTFLIIFLFSFLFCLPSSLIILTHPHPFFFSFPFGFKFFLYFCFHAFPFHALVFMYLFSMPIFPYY